MLDKIFKKLGIKDWSELTQAEKEQIKNWEKLLEEAKITDDKVKDFLKQQILLIEEELCQPDNSVKKDLYLKARLRNYRSLLNLLEREKQVNKIIEEEINKI